MNDHLLGVTKKCVSDTSGRFIDSGGLNGPYNSFEQDYFIIRTAIGVSAFVNLNFTKWNVRDYDVSTTNYDFIDVFTSATGYPNSWTWISRLGGKVHNGGDFASSPNYYINVGSNVVNIKFVFNSKNGQGFNYNGWVIKWAAAASAVGTNVAAGEGATNYDDILDLKENCLDNIFDPKQSSAYGEVFREDYFNNIDPGKDRWGFIPIGQGGREIHVIKQNLVYYGIDRSNVAQPPLSYAADDRRKIGTHLGAIRVDQKER